MIERAIFVLTSPEAGQQFLRVLPDLRGIGLSEATILHMVSAPAGPAEPMPELADWVRHFEAAIPKVRLALKRGDPVKWIYELARVHDAHVVVIWGVMNGAEWDLERVSSPLRSLGIPILYLPEQQLKGSLGQQVLIAVKTPRTLNRVERRLREWFGPGELSAIHVAASGDVPSFRGPDGFSLDIVPQQESVARTLLSHAAQRGVTLLAILTGEEAEVDEAQRGVPVVKPLLEQTERPILIWPAAD